MTEQRSLLPAGWLILGTSLAFAGPAADVGLPPFVYDRAGNVHPAPRIEGPAGTGGMLDDPYATADFVFYDTEGRAGLGVIPFGDSRLSGRSGFEDGSVYTVEGGSIPTVAVEDFGIPYWWETTNPWSGTVRGWSKSVAYLSYSRFSAPAPASEVGFSIHREGNFLGRMSMGIHVSLVDKLNTPSPLISDYMSFSGRRSILTAVYLPGNALSESVGIESHEFDEDDLVGDFVGSYWGNYASLLPLFSSEAGFATALPLGPTLMAMTFDGSTTGMIEVEGLDHIYYEAELPFAPLPGSTLPTAREVLALGEPPAFVLGPSLDAVMLRDSIDLVSDLDYHCDRNHDGVLDAADYLLWQTASH